MPECNEETWEFEVYAGDELSGSLRCPYGQPGDLLYVRETWRPTVTDVACTNEYKADGAHIEIDDTEIDASIWLSYRKSEEQHPDLVPPKWRPSIHMPRWASRLTLEITDVRVERLQDISEEDARSEGIQSKPGIAVIEGKQTPSPVYFVGGLHPEGSPSEAFRSLWSSIYSNWHTNPWVWVVEYKVHHCNVDALLREREAA